MRTRFRTAAALLLLVASCLVVSFAPGAPAGAAGVGGPVIIMGIDGEDGGPGVHGPIAVYETIVTNVQSQVANGGSGILVVGGGKSPGDDVTDFWDTVSVDTGLAVTYVNGAANIASQSFAGFAIIAVAGGNSDTSNGGVTSEESVALATRSFDVATFVNAGGGLFVFQQGNIDAAYGFLGDIGTFVAEPIDSSTASDDDVDVTPAGATAGLSDQLDVCCWHDQFSTFPSFLTVLATYVVTEPGAPAQVAALGGANVQIPTGIVLDPPTQTQFAGATCAFTATVTENELPAVGTTVRFTVTSGPNSPASGTGVSDANGVATFSYIGALVGNDTVVAEFTDTQGRVRTSDVVSCGIFAPPPTTAPPTTTPPPPPAARAVQAAPRFAG